MFLRKQEIYVLSRRRFTSKNSFVQQKQHASIKCRRKQEKHCYPTFVLSSFFSQTI